MNHPHEAETTHPPFFIVGCPRSGTTLLQRMLSAHPDVAVAPETFFVRRFWMQRNRYGDLSIDANLDRLVDGIVATPEFAEMGLDPNEFREVAQEARRSYGVLFQTLLDQFAAARGVEHVGEKTPDHVLHIPTLHRWFPEAKFIHLVRDPRAVVNSWRSVPWSSGYRWRDAEVWVEHVRAGREAESRFPAQVTSLHFEALVRSSAAELQEVCDFLEIPYDERMLAFHERTAETVDVAREPWKERATDPVDPSVADRWKEELSQSAQAQVEAVAASEMKHWGYPCAIAPLRRRVAELWAWIERPVWKLGLALEDLRAGKTDSDSQSSESAERLTLGFLHVGPSEHGVTRYGQMLAQAARAHLDASVREVALAWTRNPDRHRQQVKDAARQLAQAGVVHLQYNKRIWGGAFRALLNVRRFVSASAVPFVVTMHDVRDGYGLPGIVRRLRKQATWSPWEAVKGAAEGPEENSSSKEDMLNSGPSVARSVWKAARYVAQEISNALATWYLARQAARIFVCTKEEARRLRGLVKPSKITIIPHFVEDRPPTLDAGGAKEKLDVAGRRVLSVLGYIHRRKGHDLVVDALAHLPEDVVAVFVGRPGRRSTDFAHRLRERARELGVEDRLRITGYVSEEALDQYLAATDLALCPFREASASGSLATWIAAECPVLASNLPLFEEYNERVPGAIAIFDPLTPETLARRVEEVLQCSKSDVQERLRALRDELSLPQVIQCHAEVYRHVADWRPTGTPDQAEEA